MQDIAEVQVVECVPRVLAPQWEAVPKVVFLDRTQQRTVVHNLDTPDLEVAEETADTLSDEEERWFLPVEPLTWRALPWRDEKTFVKSQSRCSGFGNLVA